MVQEDQAALWKQIEALSVLDGRDTPATLWQLYAVYADTWEELGNSTWSRFYRWCANYKWRPFAVFGQEGIVNCMTSHYEREDDVYSYIEVPQGAPPLGKFLYRDASNLCEFDTILEAHKAIRSYMEHHNYFEKQNNG